MMHYCLESLAEFDESEYGSWPSRYPLFGLSTKDAAHSNLRLLAQWLFHPGMKSVLNVPPLHLDPDEFVGAVLVGWAFIILGEQKDDKANELADSGATPLLEEGNRLMPSDVLAILLEEIGRVCTAPQQSRLLRQWETLKELVTSKLDSSPRMDSKQRAQHKLQRALIRRLVEQLKAARKRIDTSQMNYQAVEGGN